MGFIDSTNERNALNRVIKAQELKRNSLITPMNRLLNQTPQPATYYSIDREKTTTADGFEDYYERIGANSPIRLNRINNFPMFLGVRERAEKEMDEEIGVSTTISTNIGTILDDTISPISGDMFTLKADNDQIIYIINNVDTITIRNKEVYTIEWSEYITSDDIKWGEILDQVVADYTCLYDKIGTDQKAIILSTELENLEHVEHIVKYVSISYLENFFNTKVNNLVCKHNQTIDGVLREYNLYNPYLVEFVRNRESIQYKGNKLMIDHELVAEKNFTTKYMGSIFEKIINREFIYDPLNPITTLEYYLNDQGLYSLAYYNPFKHLENVMMMEKDSTLIPFNYDLDLSRTDKYFTVIRKYVTKEELTSTDLYEVNKYISDDSFEDFLLVPIFLRIIMNWYEKLLESPKKWDRLMTTKINSF